MNNIEKYKILSQPTITTEQLQQVKPMNANKARELMRNARKKFKESGREIFLLRYEVPTEFILQELNWDLEEIHRLALKEKKLQ